MENNLEDSITAEILGKFADDEFTLRNRIPFHGFVDENGIPLCDLRRLRLTGSPTYHPVMIAQFALAHYNLAFDGVSEAAETFMRCAQWLENNAVEEPKQRFLIWPYSFPLRVPASPPGWISGMAQGEGLSVLARSYCRTRSKRTAAIAERVAKCFLYPVEEGGVVFRLSNKSCFIEELAFPPFLHILNGCQFALIGLFEYLRIFHDPKLEDVFAACVQGVEELLPHYDTGYWSLYSIGYRWNLASRHYHHTHVILFRILGRLLNNNRFLNYSDRWEQYEKSILNRLRHASTEFFQVNAQRALTVTRLYSLKYHSRSLQVAAKSM